MFLEHISCYFFPFDVPSDSIVEHPQWQSPLKKVLLTTTVILGVESAERREFSVGNRNICGYVFLV
jgi:hypothetical protein